MIEENIIQFRPRKDSLVTPTENPELGSYMKEYIEENGMGKTTFLNLSAEEAAQLDPERRDQWETVQKKAADSKGLIRFPAFPFHGRNDLPFDNSPA